MRLAIHLNALIGHLSVVKIFYHSAFRQAAKKYTNA